MGLEFWKAKRVLVTGGAGFLGSHVAEALEEAGAIVTIASRFQRQGFYFVEHLKGRVELIEGDLTEAHVADLCTRNKDAVLHFASKMAGLGYNSKHPAEMLSYNAVLDLQVLKASAQNTIPLFLYISGALVYDAEAPVPTTEDDSISGIPIEACKGAAWAKRIGETAVRYFIEERGMQIAVARLSNVYGPRDDFGRDTSHLIGNAIRLVAEGKSPEIWGDGSQRRSYLYVSDAVRALLRLAECGANKGPHNICSQYEYTVRQVVECIIEESGAPLEVVFRPGPCGCSRKLLDTGKFCALTGFKETVHLREGIRRTVEWFREYRLKIHA